MVRRSQTAAAGTSRPSVVLVAGGAGSGKSTLGIALAGELGLAPLDLDSITNPLLDRLGTEVFGGHWLSCSHSRLIRDGRYAALRAVAADLVSAGQGAVLIAPFTEELQGGPAWDLLVSAVRPARPEVLYLDGDEELLAARRGRRGAARDGHRPDRPAAEPRVDHHRIDANLSTVQQLFRARRALGRVTPVDPRHPVFRQQFDALLFDLDGTLADSTSAVLRSWARVGREFGFDPSSVHGNHGQPAVPLLRRLLQEDARVAAALARLDEYETADVAGIAPTAGAIALLESLPPERTAVVTSGSRPVALARLAAAGIRPPGVVITRDDVVRPKPDPEAYLAAASLLGVDVTRCLALEDAAAGVRSAKGAGCTVVALRGTVPESALAQADLVLDSLELIRATRAGDLVRIVPGQAPAATATGGPDGDGSAGRA